MPTPKPLLQLCQQHFPGLAWEKCGGSYCQAMLPAFCIEQKLIARAIGDGDLEVSISTNLGGWVTERIAIGPDAISQAAARWREFAAEADLVAQEQRQEAGENQ